MKKNKPKITMLCLQCALAVKESYKTLRVPGEAKSGYCSNCGAKTYLLGYEIGEALKDGTEVAG